MNISCELFSNLPDIVLLSIFSFIPDEEILILAEVNKSLRQLISSIDWGVYIITRPKRTPIMHNFSIDPLKSFEFYSPLLKTFVHGKIHKCLAPIVNGNTFHPLPITAICASSTDYDQIIENVTRDDDVSSFWSSLGHNTTECEEFALFELKKFAIIQKIKIDFFKSYQGLFYPCEFINIELGLSCDFDFKTRNYRIPANQMSVVLNLDVNFSVCRFIKLNFINKIRIQDTDNKYYIAIKKISFEGISFSIKEIMKIENGDDAFRGLFRRGIENYYENKAVKFSENKTNLVKYLDVKYNDNFDNDMRAQYFKEKLKIFQDQLDLTGFFKVVEENPDFMRQKWLFEILEKKKEFFELYFKNLELKKNRIYINVEELECHFSYHFLSKTETLNTLVNDAMSCNDYNRFIPVFKKHFSEFNASLENFDYIMVSTEFYLNLAFKIKEIAFSDKITTNELIDHFIKQHTPVFSILPKSEFLNWYPLSFYAVLESTKERLGFWKWMRNR